MSKPPRSGRSTAVGSASGGAVAGAGRAGRRGRLELDEGARCVCAGGDSGRRCSARAGGSGSDVAGAGGALSRTFRAGVGRRRGRAGSAAALRGQFKSELSVWAPCAGSPGELQRALRSVVLRSRRAAARCREQCWQNWTFVQFQVLRFYLVGALHTQKSLARLRSENSGGSKRAPFQGSVFFYSLVNPSVRSSPR